MLNVLKFLCVCIPISSEVYSSFFLKTFCESIDEAADVLLLSL